MGKIWHRSHARSGGVGVGGRHDRHLRPPPLGGQIRGLLVPARDVGDPGVERLHAHLRPPRVDQPIGDIRTGPRVSMMKSPSTRRRSRPPSPPVTHTPVTRPPGCPPSTVSEALDVDALFDADVGNRREPVAQRALDEQTRGVDHRHRCLFAWHPVVAPRSGRLPATPSCRPPASSSASSKPGNRSSIARRPEFSRKCGCLLCGMPRDARRRRG